MTSTSKKDKTSVESLKSSLFQKLALLSFLIFISISFMQCANMQKPTGGPKDSIPPKLLNVTPANLTKNFKEKNIVLTFDEYIKINNQAKEFSISPDLNTQPIYKVKKKNLVITLPDSLDANTTYTINFGKGLVDYNESNPVLNFNYVFATGSELDSLTIQGKVKNGYTKDFDLKIDKEMVV